MAEPLMPARPRESTTFDPVARASDYFWRKPWNAGSICSCCPAKCSCTKEKPGGKVPMRYKIDFTIPSQRRDPYILPPAPPPDVPDDMPDKTIVEPPNDDRVIDRLLPKPCNPCEPFEPRAPLVPSRPYIARRRRAPKAASDSCCRCCCQQVCVCYQPHACYPHHHCSSYSHSSAYDEYLRRYYHDWYAWSSSQ